MSFNITEFLVKGCFYTCEHSMRGNIGEIQPYMIEPQSDPDLEEESVVHQYQGKGEVKVRFSLQYTDA